MALLNEQSLNIVIKAHNKTSKVFNKIEKDMVTFRGKIQKMQPAFKKMAKLGAVAFAGISGFIIKSVKEFAKFEQAEVAFESMLGSASKAKEMIKELAAFSAKTPFQFDDIVQATRTLVAFGIKGDEAVKKLQFLGDISAGAQIPLAELAQIFGKITTKGKAMTEEILQLSERGIPIIDALAKHFGTTKDEIFKMAQTGKLTADVVEEALKGMTGKGAIFEDQMAKQSKTISGLFSTLKDNISLTMAAIGGTFSEEIGKMITKITEITGKILEWIKVNPELVKKIILVSGAFAGLIMGIGIVGIAFATTAGMVALVTAAIGLLVIGALIFKEKFAEIADFIDEKTGLITLFKESWDEIVTTFNETLLPVFRELWETLKPLAPILKFIGKVIGVFLLVVIKSIIGTITSFVKILTWLIAITIKVAAAIVKNLIDPIEGFIDKIKSAIEWVSKLLSKLGGIGGKAAKKVGKILGFEHGGTVPGPVGQAVPIIAHGQERIIPANQSGNGGGMFVVNINNPTVRNNNDINIIRNQVENAFRDVVRNHKLTTI